MTDIERDTERRITTLETNVNNLITELRDFKTEIRQQNQMRAEELREIRQRQDAAQAKHDAEMREIRQRQDAAQAKHDAEMREIRQRQEDAQAKHDAEMKEMNARFDAKFDKISDQIHTMTITAVVGFGAIAAAVGGLVFAAFR